MKTETEGRLKYTMVIETSDYLHRLEAQQLNLFTQKLHNGISNALSKFQGKVLKQNDNTYLVEFESVTNAILCALKIQSNFKILSARSPEQPIIASIWSRREVRPIWDKKNHPKHLHSYHGLD